MIVDKSGKIAVKNAKRPDQQKELFQQLLEIR